MTDDDPDGTEEEVLGLVAEERRVTPRLVRERTGLEEGRAEETLDALTAAGRLREVTEGLYEYVEDGPDGGAATDDRATRGIPAMNENTRTAPIEPDEENSSAGDTLPAGDDGEAGDGRPGGEEGSAGTERPDEESDSAGDTPSDGDDEEDR